MKKQNNMEVHHTLSTLEERIKRTQNQSQMYLSLKKVAAGKIAEKAEKKKQDWGNK